MEDVCGTIQDVNARMDAGLTGDESQELALQEAACIDSLRSVIVHFVELCVLCNAHDFLSNLTAALGEKYAGRLGVEASGRKMRLQAVSSALTRAFSLRSYGKPLNHGEHAWDPPARLFNGHLMAIQYYITIRWQLSLLIAIYCHHMAINGCGIVLKLFFIAVIDFKS